VSVYACGLKVTAA